MDLFGGKDVLKSPYLDLLLEADPRPEAVYKYMQLCQALCDVRNGALTGICAYGPASDFEGLEIYNLSVAPAFRRSGIGSRLLQRMLELEKGPIRVRTGSTSFAALSLYQKLGFRMKSIVSDYFTNHYAEPIIENGIQLRDQIVLELKDRSSGHLFGN